MSKYIEFFPIINSAIKLEFKCNNCQSIIKTEEFYLPYPNYMTEKASDSHVIIEEFAVCENCGKDFTIGICVGYADAYVYIEELDDEDDVNVIEIQDKYDEFIDAQIDSFLATFTTFSSFNKEISNLRKLNELKLNDDELEKILKRQIYSGVVTCLEDYLSTTLINKVLKDDSLFRRFVETYKGFKDKKFSLNQIFMQQEELRKKVKRTLLDIIYHNLDKIKGIYENTFEIKFPDIEAMMKIINNRHHMVHRNGKDKDGKEIALDTESVEKVISTVEEFIKSIEVLLTNKTYKSTLSIQL